MSRWRRCWRVLHGTCVMKIMIITEGETLLSLTKTALMTISYIHVKPCITKAWIHAENSKHVPNNKHLNEKNMCLKLEEKTTMIKISKCSRVPWLMQCRQSRWASPAHHSPPLGTRCWNRTTCEHRIMCDVYNRIMIICMEKLGTSTKQINWNTLWHHVPSLYIIFIQIC